MVAQAIDKAPRESNQVIGRKSAVTIMILFMMLYNASV